MTSDALLQLLYAGALGCIGQCLRVLVGLKKLSDASKEKNLRLKTTLDFKRMIISLLIGFLAGGLALSVLGGFDYTFFNGPNARQNIFAIIAAGYAGTDFIEGLMKSLHPKGDGLKQHK